ncbi:MAG TPA: 16S rRNA (guanine(527)-N(7))-methyltransferase RsmG [Flexilinea sp.]|nr:16S rRNA (guanine(527)-N(7))-methyltransferase RsmG [Flexilinea sp.]HQN62567.1 16S rRNA (guanine(527)-N(7))-methyltransferase RsmG [Flexilinea sp.]
MQHMSEWIDIAAQFIGFPLSEDRLRLFEIYESELIEWNTRFNLTAIKNPDEIRTKHFLDSLSCALAINDFNGRSLVDVGTGAGFPGIPLKIVFPDLKLTLVDSVGKKLVFCQHIIDRLSLTDCRIIHARAEDLGKDPLHRERYDIAVARAVTGLSALSELLLPLVKRKGIMIAQKGETAAEELKAAEKAIRILGGGETQLIPVTIPNAAEPRYLIRIEKQRNTPSGYPRRPDQIRKKPID